MSNTRIERTDLARTALYDKVNLIADEIDTGLEAKQDVLTAGTDIEIIKMSDTQTVSGTNMVTFSGAKGLDSVTIFGFCEQNDTPTADNPVNIVCNNGEIIWDSVKEQIITNGTVETLSDSLNNTAVAQMLLSLDSYKDEQDVISGTITRKIKIMVFDGSENWIRSPVGGTTRFNLVLNERATRPTGSRGNIISTHFVNIGDSALQTVGGAFTSQGLTLFVIPEQTLTTVEDFKNWLAQEYAKGTPVMILYPLEEAITETVTAQRLKVKNGENTIEITQASAENLTLTVTYIERDSSIINFTNDSEFITSSALAPYATTSYVDNGLIGKQATLVSGTNIKTVNNQSLLGSGNIDIQGGSGADLLSTNNIFTGTNVFNYYDDNISGQPAFGVIANIDNADATIEHTYYSFSVITDQFYIGSWLEGTQSGNKNYILSSEDLGFRVVGYNDIRVIAGQDLYLTATYDVDMSDSGRVLLPTPDNDASVTEGVNIDYLNTRLSGYQTTLVSGTNIKTINGNSLLGSGNIEIQSGATYTAGDGILIENDEISVDGVQTSELTIDTTPTEHSSNLITSGGVYDALSGYALDTDVVHKTGTETITGTKTFLAKTYMAPIELYPLSSGSPYIDFHYDQSESDYTSRIIEQASGDLVVTANNFTINANGYARASDTNGSIVTTVNKSKATNGYFQLGNGMIVNWGFVSSWTSNAAQVTFSKAFTTTRQVAIARSAGATTTNDGGDYYVRGLSNTGFDMYRTSTSTGGVSWIAIGY